MSYLIDKETPLQYRCKSKWCLAWNHWINPFGNWIEPLPYPENRAKEAALSGWIPSLWWGVRNFGNNFGTFWIGIQPLGPRYCTIKPESNGWVRTKYGYFSLWRKKNRIPLPYFNYSGKFEILIGWTSRGNFGIGFTRSVK
jgi:hypothetical protein